MPKHGPASDGDKSAAPPHFARAADGDLRTPFHGEGTPLKIFRRILETAVTN